MKIISKLFLMMFVCSSLIWAASSQQSKQFEHVLRHHINSQSSPVNSVSSLNGEFGGISGTISGVNDEDIKTAWVEVFPADSIVGDGNYKGWTYIKEDGSYEINELSPGNYYVFSGAENYETVYYKNARALKDAVPVQINENEISNDINITLTPRTAGEGSISGQVVLAKDNSSLEGLVVSAVSPTNPWHSGRAVTDENGTYAIQHLNADDYVVTVWSEYFVPQYFDKVDSLSQATLVNVTEPNNTPNINFSLKTGGVIEGRVVDGQGHPLPEVFIEIVVASMDSATFDSLGAELPAWDYYGFKKGITDMDGYYSIAGLTAGEYRVKSTYWHHWGYEEKWYDNVNSLPQSTPVTVVEEETVSNIDFVMDAEAPQGQISGTVSDENGDPISNVYVRIEKHDIFDMGPFYQEEIYTDENGEYTANNLPNGRYFVSVWLQSGRRYITQWWPDEETMREAEPIVIDEENPEFTADFTIDAAFPKGVVSGTVTDLTGAPLANAYISLQPLENDTMFYTREIWANATSDSNGFYIIKYLPEGEYLAYASYYANDNYAQQWFDGADSVQAATPIVLAKDEQVENINFNLDPQPMYGTLNGKLTGADTGLPLPGMISIMPAWDSDLMARSCWMGPTQIVVEEDGVFEFSHLYEGEYVLHAFVDGAHQYYPNGQSYETAEHIIIKRGEVSTISFPITRQTCGDKSGKMTGSVQIAQVNETPLAVVLATPAYTNNTTGFCAIAQDGDYEFTCLPVGDYIVQSFSMWTIAQYYDNVYDPEQATLVSIVENETTSGIDFNLTAIRTYGPEGGDDKNSGLAITGQVTNSNDETVDGAIIYVLNDQQEIIAQGKTQANGNYVITSLSPGSFWIKATHANYRTQFNGGFEALVDAQPITAVNGTVRMDFVLETRDVTQVGNAPIVPNNLVLEENYPNPFNPETMIKFSLPTDMHVNLAIYNMQGKLVTTLVDKKLKRGWHQTIWNGTDRSSNPVASGIYMYRLISPQTVLTGKMAFIK